MENSGLCFKKKKKSEGTTCREPQVQPCLNTVGNTDQHRCAQPCDSYHSWLDAGPDIPRSLHTGPHLCKGDCIDKEPALLSAKVPGGLVTH